MNKFYAVIACFFTLSLGLLPTKGHSQVYWSEDFDGIGGPTAGGAGTYTFPAGWLLRNVDNAVNEIPVSYINDAWERREDFSFNVADSAAFSTSWTFPVGQVDDWMWTPPTLIQPNSYLHWNGVAYDPLFPDGYQVRIMLQSVTPGGPTGGSGAIGNQVTNSTLLLTVPAENSTWTARNLSLSAYSGQTVWIAFRNNSVDQFLLLIDDVSICAAPNQPGAITGNIAVCSGSSQTYSIAAVPGATSYTWTLPGGWTGTSTTNSITATVGASSGNITVTANSSCGASPVQTLAVTVSTFTPVQPGSVFGPTSICANSTNTYSVVPPTPGATSYTWTLPGGWTGTSTTSSINATAGATGGTISVTANNACGSSPAQTLSVSIATVPAQPGSISGNVTVCQGSNNTYSVASVPGATSYTWTLPGGWTGTSTTNSISTTAGSTGGSITVVANNACGSSTPRTLTVTVVPVPAQPGLISGSNPICANSTNTFTVPSDPLATSYTWTLPAGWTGTSTTNSITTTANGMGGVISVTANNACGSSAPQSMTIVVATVPTQPTSITGPILICAGSTNTYSVPSNPLATSYTWTLPAGWSGSSTTNSITVVAGSTGGTISVTADNPCGPSTPQTLNVTIDTIPGAPTSIVGNLTPCETANETYSTPLVPGATSYTWTLPPGWTGTSTTETINVVVGANSGTISVTASNACGTSAPFSDTVTVSPVPSPAGTISGPDTLCSGSTDTFFVAAVAGATDYTWTLPAGWSGSSTIDSITATAGTLSGYITITANNACGASPIDSLFVTVLSTPAQPGPIAGDTAVCTGSINTYSVAPVPGASGYVWTLPAGWSGSSTTETINATAGAAGGTISVFTVNACGVSSVDSILVSMASGPVAQYNSSVVSLTASFNNTSSNNPTSYAWDFGDGNTSTAINPSHTYVNGGTYTVCLVATNLCGSDTTCSSVTVCEMPGASFTSAVTNLVVNFSDISAGTPTSWFWTFGDGGTSTVQNPAYTYSTPGSYTVCLVTTNPCGSDTTCNTVNITCAVPVSNFFYAALANEVDFTNTGTAGAGITYSWDFGDGGTSTQQNPTHIYAAPGIYDCCLIVSGGCGADTFCTDVVVNCLVPVGDFTYGGNINGMSFTDQSLNAPVSWSWNFGDGGTSTQQNPNHTFAAVGDYNVCLTVNNQCGSHTFCQIVSVLIGVEDPNGVTDLQVYPNPATDQVTFDAGFANSLEVNVRLTDLYGRVVMQTAVLPDGNRIHLGIATKGLASGMYMVEVEQDGQIANTRLVIE